MIDIDTLTQEDVGKHVWVSRWAADFELCELLSWNIGPMGTPLLQVSRTNGETHWVKAVHVVWKTMSTVIKPHEDTAFEIAQLEEFKLHQFAEAFGVE